MKTKHIIKHFFSIFCLILLTIGFLACNNLINPNQKKANIKISAVLPVKKTVLPSALTEETKGLIWTLTGTKGSETSLTKPWVDSDSQTAYQIMQADSFAIDQGAWTFTLIATNKEQNELLTSTINCNVTSDTPLSFVMQQATGNNAAKGSINFTLSFPANIVSNVEAYLYPWDELTNDFSENKQNPKSITPDNENNTGSVTCNFDNVSSGYYMLKLDLQQSINGNNKTINYYTCLVRVAPGLCSMGNAKLTDLAELYTITYELNEGNFNDNEVIQKTYNKYTSIDLPTPIKEGHEFTGWYEDVNLATKVETPLKITGDTTLYAGWVANTQTEAEININELQNVIIKGGTFVFPRNTTNQQLLELNSTILNTETSYYFTFDLSQTSITELLPNTFFGITNLEKIIFPTTLNKIGSGAFGLCTGLCTFELNDNTNFSVNQGNGFQVLYQGNVLIAAPGMQADYEILEGTTTIADYAFTSTTSDFCTLTIPSTVTNISPTAFYGFHHLEKFITNDSTTYSTINDESSQSNMLTSYDKTRLIAWPCADRYDVTIPATITHIGDYAFAYIDIESLNLNNVEKIGKYAFYYNSESLQNLTIPSSVTYIDKNAFYCCESLTSVTFKNADNWYVKNTEDGALQTIDVTNPETNAENLTTKDFIWVYLPDTSTEGDASEGTLSINETVSTYDELTQAIAKTNSDGTPYVIGIKGEITLTQSLEIKNNIQLVAASEGAKIINNTSKMIVASQDAQLTLGAENTPNLVIDGNNKSSIYSLITINGTCTLNENCTITQANTEGKGGAIKVNGGTLNMHGGTITNNSATNGGGIAVMTTGSKLNISGGTITNNSATNVYGGGIYIESYGTHTIKNINFANNSSSENGIDIYNGQSGNLTIQDCTFGSYDKFAIYTKYTGVTVDGTNLQAETGWSPPKEVRTLDELKSALLNDTIDTIIIAADFDFSTYCDIKRKVTILANEDHTITGNTTLRMFYLNNADVTFGGGTGMLTIKSTIKSHVIGTEINSSTITIKDNVMFTELSESAIYITVDNTFLNIEGGEFVNNTYPPIYSAADATINISGGNITYNKTELIDKTETSGAAIIINGGTLNITGGEIKNNTNTILNQTGSSISYNVNTSIKIDDEPINTSEVGIYWNVYPSN